ncbi:MAG TPA: hypothetical protein VMR34_04355 [Candidatus Saccharimonadales bacterium]|nr:hypothetical protein [Candidatus Saccharimonadales bacterium]
MSSKEPKPRLPHLSPRKIALVAAAAGTLAGLAIAERVEQSTPAHQNVDPIVNSQAGLLNGSFQRLSSDIKRVAHDHSKDTQANIVPDQVFNSSGTSTIIDTPVDRGKQQVSIWLFSPKVEGPTNPSQEVINSTIHISEQPTGSPKGSNATVEYTLVRSNFGDWDLSVGAKGSIVGSYSSNPYVDAAHRLSEKQVMSHIDHMESMIDSAA